MKICILGDCHWGARNDNPHITSHFKKFFGDILFPYLKQNNISHIIQLGDIVDRRKYINILTAHELYNSFISKCIENDISLDIICGNHDTYYKTTNEINILNVLFKDKNYDKIKYYWKPEHIVLGNRKLLYLPWICEDNIEEVENIIQESDAEYLFSHLELSGFEMYAGGVMNTDGLDPSIFSKFKHVFSGHYHNRSTKNNISYVGTPYEIIWSDYNSIHGFDIFDISNETREFVENPYKLFHKIIYDEKQKYNFEEYRNSYVKVIFEEGKKYNKQKIDIFLEKLNKVEPIDIDTIDENEILNNNENIILENIEDIMNVFSTSINNIDNVDDDKKKNLHKKIGELYNLAQQVE